MPIYALNLFDVSDRNEYLAYSRRSTKEVHAHGGRVVALGKFRESATGDITPRTVLVLVEWASKEAFDGQTLRHMVAEGPLVAVWATYEGAQKGPMGPFRASGKRMQLEFAAFLRVEGSKIAEMWVTWDNMAALGQLGHLPSTPSTNA